MNYFKYILSEDEIDKILNDEKISTKKTFTTKKGINIDVEIRYDYFSYMYEKMRHPKMFVYFPNLILTPVTIESIKDDKGDRELICICIDAVTNRTNKIDYLEEKIHALLNECDYDLVIDTKYLLDLINYTDFNNNDDFLDLCMVYMSYRLNNKQDNYIFDTFNDKLNYYGYDEWDLNNQKSFNDCKSANFLVLTSLAMTILYRHSTKKKIDLSTVRILDEDFELDAEKVKDLYMNYHKE